jgi:hypothetical protein
MRICLACFEHMKTLPYISRVHIRVQRIWLFFRKWRIQTLWWVQNWNLRHIYKIRFCFSSRFLRVWLQSLKKALIWPLKKFCYQKGVNKRRISRWFRIRRKSCQKLHQKNVISKTSLTNMSKIEKVHFSITFLLITFFVCIFTELFQQIQDQLEILRFWTPFLI